MSSSVAARGGVASVKVRISLSLSRFFFSDERNEFCFIIEGGLPLRKKETAPLRCVVATRWFSRDDLSYPFWRRRSKNETDRVDVLGGDLLPWRSSSSERTTTTIDASSSSSSTSHLGGRSDRICVSLLSIIIVVRGDASLFVVAPFARKRRRTFSSRQRQKNVH